MSYSLFPWTTVLGNVMMGPILLGTPKTQATTLALDWLRRVGLSGFEDRYSHQLSGGMRKRVAMAAALINRPRVLLIDEPFGALDVQTKAIMQGELLQLVQLSGAPGERVMCSAKRGVNSAADFKGKILGVTDLGSGTDELTHFLASENGITRSQYTTLAVGAGKTGIAAIQRGSADCVMTECQPRCRSGCRRRSCRDDALDQHALGN